MTWTKEQRRDYERNRRSKLKGWSRIRRLRKQRIYNARHRLDHSALIQEIVDRIGAIWQRRLEEGFQLMNENQRRYEE